MDNLTGRLLGRPFLLDVPKANRASKDPRTHCCMANTKHTNTHLYYHRARTLLLSAIPFVDVPAIYCFNYKTHMMKTVVLFGLLCHFLLIIWPAHTISRLKEGSTPENVLPSSCLHLDTNCKKLSMLK